MALQHAYTLLAPFYDGIIERVSRQWRQDSLRGLGDVHGKNILIDGIGSGLDIPYLAAQAHYTGIDLTPAMLKRAGRRAALTGRQVILHQGDAMNLPYQDAQFDAIVMHLIIAVVPHPERALAEAERVLKPGGTIIILDKFLRAGQWAPLRRLISPLLGKIATRTDVVFEDALKSCPRLVVLSDVALIAGWFRRIVLRKD
jgi:ubiquinone/menaquinone biosynthesis C-methylase UbiE